VEVTYPSSVQFESPFLGGVVVFVCVCVCDHLLLLRVLDFVVLLKTICNGTKYTAFNSFFL